MKAKAKNSIFAIITNSGQGRLLDLKFVPQVLSLFLKRSQAGHLYLYEIIFIIQFLLFNYNLQVNKQHSILILRSFESLKRTHMNILNSMKEPQPMKRFDFKIINQCDKKHDELCTLHRTVVSSINNMFQLQQ